MSDWVMYFNFALLGFVFALGLWTWDRFPVSENGWRGLLRRLSFSLVLGSLTTFNIVLGLVNT